MDFQRDYILRLIEMMGDFMRRLAERLDDLERMRMLDESAREFCGMTLETGEALSLDSLRDMLAPVPRFMLSELLAAKAEVCSLPIGEAEELKLKALRLLSSLYGEAQLCDLRARKLAALKAEVFELLTSDDLMACARFFSQAEQFDEMEDALFQAMETGAASAGDRAEAVRLLRQAAKATEKTLALCHMTGHELRESARELETENNPQEQENPE